MGVVAMVGCYLVNAATDISVQIVFMVMMVLLVIQLKLTNKNRKLIFNVVRITLGITTSLGLLGSMGILLYKIINAKRQSGTKGKMLEE